MSKPMEAVLYGGRVELRRGANHVYRVRVEGGRSYPCPNVTTIIGMKDKSRALLKWQQKVIAFVVDEHARALASQLPGVGVSFRFTDHAKSSMMAGIRAMVDSVHTASDEVRDAAGDTGQQVHQYVEDYMALKMREQGGEKGLRAPGTTGLDREVKRACGRFAKWFTDNEVLVHAIERPVFSRQHFYTGTLDYDLTVAGVRGIWDAKSGASVYPEVMMQRAAYREGLSEEFPDRKYGAGGVLFFEREEVNPRVKVMTGEFEVVDLPDTHERDFEAFLACKTLYRFDRDGYKELRKARGFD